MNPADIEVKMSLVSRLSKYLLIPVLLEWLDTIDYLSLDTAACSRTLRPILLDLVRQYPNLFQNHLFSPSTQLPLSNCLFDWSIQRNLSLQKLTIHLTNTTMNEYRPRPKLKSRLIFWKKSCVAVQNPDLDNRNRLFCHLSSVAILKIIQCSDSNLPFFIEVIKRCVNLEEIKVTNQYSLAVDTIADCCPHLRVGNLDGCTQLSEQLVISILRNCSQLHTLCVQDCKNLSRAFVHSLITNCTELRVLNLQGCVKITEHDILTLSLHSRFLLTQFMYREFSYLALCTFLHYRGDQLNTMEAYHNVYLTDTTAPEIVAICPRLTSLSLINCTYVDDTVLHTLIDALSPHLTQLTLHWLPSISDDALHILLQQCTSLKELSLCSNRLLTSAWLHLIGTSCAALCTLCLRSMNLTDDLLIAIVMPLKHLTDLDVSFNFELTNKALMILSPHSERLQRLQVAWLHHVTDQALFAVAKHCRSLTELNLDGCKLISDRGLLRIGSSIAALTKLDITRCTLLTPLALTRVCVNCYRLSSLNLNGCTVLNTVVCLRDIIAASKKLKLLKVSHITIKEAGQLKAYAEDVNPDLQLVLLYLVV